VAVPRRNLFQSFDFTAAAPGHQARQRLVKRC
jgi:hypothetical protein